MRTIAAALLALALSLPAAAQGWPPLPVRLVLVESPGETFTEARAGAAYAALADALAWWHRYAPSPVPVALDPAPSSLTVADPWGRTVLTADGAGLTVYVVANEARRLLLYGGHHGGYAAPGVVAAAERSAHGLAAVLAHELGHALYGLPDRYGVPGACTRLDIMCYPGPAYRAGRVGCGSLAALGAPCHEAWLPAVNSP